MSEIVEQVKPDLIFVQGDTTTVLASALAGFYKGVPIAHLEAGLRTHNKLSPFPEEVNRILTSHLTDYHFAPTARAVANLTAEGICANVYRVGNTVIDALHIGLDIIRRENTGEYIRHFDFLNPEKKIILITGHRRESFGEPFKNICEALRDIATAFPAVQLVYPVHLNPNVKNVVYSRLKGIANVHLIAPLPYPQLIWLMEKSYMVLTDSGGIQEEAPALGKPVLVMREHTERQEGVDAGTARLVGTDRERIYQAVSELLTDAAAYTTIANAVNPYGDGTASEQVIKILKEHLGDAQ